MTVVLSTWLKNKKSQLNNHFFSYSSQLFLRIGSCGSLVSPGTQQIRDQSVSLTGICATESWPVHWTEPQISDDVGWPKGCSLWLCRRLVGSSLCTRHLSRWKLEQQRPQGWKSHQEAVPEPCTEKMKRTSSPGNAGQTLLHLHHPQNQISSRTSVLPPFMLLFLPFLLLQEKTTNPTEYGVWPPGVCGPCLLNKGADCLIDRPSAVPAPYVSWFAALYMNPLLVCPALALVKCGVWWMAPIFHQNPDEPPKHLSSSPGFSPGKPHEHKGTGVL